MAWEATTTAADDLSHISTIEQTKKRLRICTRSEFGSLVKNNRRDLFSVLVRLWYTSLTKEKGIIKIWLAETDDRHATSLMVTDGTDYSWWWCWCWWLLFGSQFLVVFDFYSQTESESKRERESVCLTVRKHGQSVRAENRKHKTFQSSHSVSHDAAAHFLLLSFPTTVYSRRRRLLLLVVCSRPGHRSRSYYYCCCFYLNLLSFTFFCLPKVHHQQCGKTLASTWQWQWWWWWSAWRVLITTTETG